MRKRRITSILSDVWQPLLIALGVVTLLCILFLYRFGDIAPHVVPGELSLAHSGLNDILKSPLHLHQQIIHKLILLAQGSALLATRMPSAINAIIGLTSFYFIAKAWYTRRIALLGTLLFATSSWLLHIARIGTTDSSYLLLTVPVLALIMLRANKYSLKGSLLLLFSGIVLLYIPGFIWLIVPVLIWRRKFIVQTIRNLSPWAFGVLSLCIIFGLLPLVVATIHDVQFLLTIAGFPHELSRLTEAPGQFIEGIKSLFILREPNPLLGIARLPFVAIAPAVLILLGGVEAYKERKLDRTKMIIIIIATGLLLHATSLGAVSLTFVAPFLFLYATAGLVYLLKQWSAVFPKNPLAEKVALIAIIIVVCSVSVLGITKYFIAWPHSDGYSAVFQPSE